MTDDEVLLVTVTCPLASAETIALALLEAHLAACVNILPGLRSIYRWNGAIHHDEEALLIIKTTQNRFDALRACVLAQHPYELPEIVAVKLAASHAPYLQWVIESCAVPQT